MHELPLATEEYQKSEKNFSSDKAVGFGKVRARVAYGGQVGIDEAVASGELMMTKKEGKEYFFERQFEAGTKKATNKSQRVAGQSKLDKDAYKAFATAIEGITFSIEFTKSEVKQIEDGKLPESVLEKIRKAGQACNTAMKDSDKILKNFSASSVNAKAAYKKLVESKKVDIGIVLWSKYSCFLSRAT